MGVVVVVGAPPEGRFHTQKGAGAPTQLQSKRDELALKSGAKTSEWLTLEVRGKQEGRGEENSLGASPLSRFQLSLRSSAFPLVSSLFQAYSSQGGTQPEEGITLDRLAPGRSDPPFIQERQSSSLTTYYVCLIRPSEQPLESSSPACGLGCWRTERMLGQKAQGRLVWWTKRKQKNRKWRSLLLQEHSDWQGAS
ncbi:hypothetical protein EYF80_007510 [Liparis tanakae]|uniref:Uncharacterized protein n=1 Tax=Liparis tanakae TaxID=230148 RepID=A0A4Z2IXW5_9TELE|nr:hypothetical protein EYF80_007510 [Liparis tanakae]